VTPNIRTPLFIFGVALALVAFLVMLAFGLLFANRAQVSTPVSVVVAARDIDAREPLTADMLTTTSLPSTASSLCQSCAGKHAGQGGGRRAGHRCP